MGEKTYGAGFSAAVLFITEEGVLTGGKLHAYLVSSARLQSNKDIRARLIVICNCAENFIGEACFLHAFSLALDYEALILR